jgi:hypothetical protein
MQLVARMPRAWRLIRRPTKRFFDSLAAGWDTRVQPDSPEHLAALFAGKECRPWQWPGVLALCDQVGVTVYRLHWLHEGPDPVELEKDVAKLVAGDVSPPGSADR